MTVIQVENLGKKYTIGHQKGTRYQTLRDTLAHTGRGIVQRLRHPLSPNREIVDLEEIWALRDVNFEIKQGERVGIIGRNGAGKSTLLKILSRITHPTTGRVTLNGRVASLLEVGTGFHPELSGRENIYLNGAILGMARQEIKGKFDEIVAFAEVEKFLDTPVKHYSSGMYVRLAFAVAAHLEPEILLVDEVLAVGDAQFQKKCLGKMEDVAKEGRTVLFVSHNLVAIKTLCQRVILLENGILLIDESPKEAIDQYIKDSEPSQILIREWSCEKEAPQNFSAALKKVYICDDNGAMLDKIYTNTPFNIAIEFKVKKGHAFIGITIIFYTSDGVCVFSSINNFEKNFYGKPMKIGTYRTLSKIPANFFNNGYFNLSINFWGPNFSDSTMVNEILRLDILDSDTLRRDYYGGYGGVIRPCLNWITEMI